MSVERRPPFSVRLPAGIAKTWATRYIPVAYATHACACFVDSAPIDTSAKAVSPVATNLAFSTQSTKAPWHGTAMGMKEIRRTTVGHKNQMDQDLSWDSHYGSKRIAIWEARCTKCEWEHDESIEPGPSILLVVLAIAWTVWPSVIILWRLRSCSYEKRRDHPLPPEHHYFRIMDLRPFVECDDGDKSRKAKRARRGFSGWVGRHNILMDPVLNMLSKARLFLRAGETLRNDFRARVPNIQVSVFTFTDMDYSPELLDPVLPAQRARKVPCCVAAPKRGRLRCIAFLACMLLQGTCVAWGASPLSTFLRTVSVAACPLQGQRVFESRERIAARVRSAVPVPVCTHENTRGSVGVR